MKSLRHAALQSMSSKSPRIRSCALRSAWLAEERGYTESEIYKRLKRYGFPNYLLMIRKQYRLHVGFVLASGSLITKGVREARGENG
jgi:hypothetical protein